MYNIVEIYEEPRTIVFRGYRTLSEDVNSQRKDTQLNIHQVSRLQGQVSSKIERADFKGALKLTRRIQALGPDPRVSYLVGGFLVDIGSALGREEILREGVELLKRDFTAITQGKQYAASSWYNLGNGYYALFRFRKRTHPASILFTSTELDQAKTCYRTALLHDPTPSSLAANVWTNLGNTLDRLGRVLDALECYDEALKKEEAHGMALGNKAMALLRYAHLMGEHEGTFMLEAHSLLSRALQSGVPLEATNIFSKHLDLIAQSFPDKKKLTGPYEYPGYEIKAKSKFEKFLMEFCMKHRLYLNPCTFCQKCNASIGDTAVIQKMIVPIDRGTDSEGDFLKNDPFLRLSSYLNQIKQDYVTARFLLVLSRYEGMNLHFVDKYVRITDTLDYSMHNIYIELVKSSFQSFYNILDKIAHFVCVYLSLGISQRSIGFRTYWYSDWKKKNIRKKIRETGSLSLNALFNIHKDFEDGPYEGLRKTRDALTHRFVSVRMFREEDDSENMTEETLVRRTIELARIVRNAVIYLLQFVHIEETRKEAQSGGRFAPLFAPDVPDNLKSYR